MANAVVAKQGGHKMKVFVKRKVINKLNLIRETLEFMKATKQPSSPQKGTAG